MLRVRLKYFRFSFKISGDVKSSYYQVIRVSETSYMIRRDCASVDPIRWRFQGIKFMSKRLEIVLTKRLPVFSQNNIIYSRLSIRNS